MAAGKHKPADSLRDGEKELGRRRMRWFCVHHDMVTDPKWRLVARRSGRPLTEVLAVALALMTNASQNESARGSLKGWSDDVQAVALDMEAEHLAAIRLELEGLVMDGDSFTGWAKRQLKRDDVLEIAPVLTASEGEARPRRQPVKVRRPVAVA